jgi:hypothetical protein
MTNLMQQLQAWANRGAFKFPEGDDKGGFTADLNDPEGLYMKGEGTELVVNPQMQWAIEMVLGGIIPVWRPVEFYRPPEDIILCLSSGLGRRTGIVKREEDGYWLPTPESPFAKAVKITHWQPLPALPPPKEGE